MELEGHADFPYDPEQVWSALHDIEILARVIPGCNSMAADGKDRYRVTLSLGVAAIKGEYEGKILVNDIDFPRHYVLNAEGAGKPGFVNMKVNCHLEPKPGGTLMHWSCKAAIGGLIAGIGGRVLSGISRHLAREFFKELIEQMGKHYVPVQVKG